MTTSSFLVLLVLAFILISLYLEIIGPAFTFVVGVVFLGITGVLTPKEMLAGFANEQILVIIMLLLIGDVIRKTAVMEPLFDRLFRGTKSGRGFLLKMMLPTAGLSAFMNNTPLVAIMMPYIQNWCRRNNLPPSKFLIPLSYATILGGCATLIGTSTNLIIAGMVNDQQQVPGMRPLNMFDFAWVGVPMIVIGILYLFLFSNRLLPDRKGLPDSLAGYERNYVVEAEILEGSKLAGQLIRESGILKLKELSLMEVRHPLFLQVENGNGGAYDRIPSTSESYRLKEGDLLIFTGNTTAVSELVGTHEGLALHEASQLTRRGSLKVVEVVVSHNSSLVSRTIHECRFRSRFDAVVLGIHRNGEKIQEKTADIKLKPGDVILLLAGHGFQARADETRDFYYLNQVREIHKPGLFKSLLILGGLATVIMLSIFGVVKLLMGLAVLLMLLLLTKIANPKEVAKSIDYDLGLIIVMALALGTAMSKTGLAHSIATGVIEATRPLGVIGIMIGLYAITTILAAYITTKAAAALMFPIALSTAVSLGANPLPFVLLTAFASAATFITPHGYQTNLMVYGPGGYRFRDFFRIGLPINLLYMAVTITILYLMYFI